MSRWKAGIAALHASLISADAGRHFLLPRSVHPDSAQLCTFRAPPWTSRQSLGTNSTSDNTCFEKPSSTAVASRIFFLFFQKKLFLCCTCFAPEPQLSHFLSLSLLQTNSVSPKRFMVLCEVFAEPFLSLSWGLRALNPHLKNQRLPCRKHTKSRKCLIHELKP